MSVLPESGANYFMLCDDQGTFEGALQGSIRVSYDEGCSNPCSGTMTTLTLASIETTGASESVPLFDFGQIGHSTGEVQFSPDGTPTFVSFRAIVPTGHVVTAAGTLSLAEAPLNPWGIGIDAKGGFSAPFIVEAEPMGGCSWSVLVQPGGSVENR